MLKKILISVLSVLVFLILITGGFRYAVNICNDYLLPEDGSVQKRNWRLRKIEPWIICLLWIRHPLNRLRRPPHRFRILRAVPDCFPGARNTAP